MHNLTRKKDLVSNILATFSQLLLPTYSPSSDSLTEDIFNLASLQQQCSRDVPAVKLEKWSLIE